MTATASLRPSPPPTPAHGSRPRCADRPPCAPRRSPTPVGDDDEALAAPQRAAAERAAPRAARSACARSLLAVLPPILGIALFVGIWALVVA